MCWLWSESTYLSSKNGSNGSISLVNEDQILDDERNQSLDSTRPQSMKNSGTNMAIKGSTGAGPES